MMNTQCDTNRCLCAVL